MKYTLVMRGHPRYPEREKKAYACAQYEKTLSLDEFVDYIIFHGSSYRKGDYKAMISIIAEALAKKMADGYRVDLEEMGVFYPTLDCEAAESKADFDPDKHIKAVRVNWKPSDEFQDLKQKTNFYENIVRRKQKKVIKDDFKKMNKDEE